MRLTLLRKRGLEELDLPGGDLAGHFFAQSSDEYPDPTQYFPLRCLEDPEEELPRRIPEKRFAGEDGPESRQPSEPFIAGHLGAAPTPEEVGHFALRETRALPMGSQIVW